MTELEGLVDAVRDAAAPRTWSRGVVIAREGRVDIVSEADDELVLEVSVQERPVPLNVILYPETEEWDCDCGTRLDVCPHVVGAVLVCQQVKKSGGQAPKSKRPRATLRYNLTRQKGLLAVARVRVLPDGTEHPLTGDPRREASKREGGLDLVLADADLGLEPLLKEGKALIELREQLQRIFQHLSEASDIRFEGAPVTVSAKERVRPVGRVFKRGERFVFAIERNPSVERVVAPEVVKTAEGLRMLGEVPLSGPKLEKLPVEKVYGRSEVGSLVQEVLPLFEDRFPISIECELPTAGGRGRPYIDFGVAMTERAISVTPTLVYGDPVVLRIEAGRPVVVGKGPVPGRDRDAEHQLSEQVRTELNLRLDHTTTVDGAGGATLLQKVRTFEVTSGRALEESGVALLEAKLTVDENGGFQLELEGTDEEGTRVRSDASAALAAFTAGHGLVPLLDGGWGRLSPKWWAEHADEVALLLQLRDPEGKVPPFALPTLGKLAEALDAPAPPGLERLTPLFSDFEGLPSAELPSDLSAELRSYQRTGVDWLSFLRDAGLGGLLADDMGLGKTLQTICVLKARSLVVCPTSVLQNWAKEIAKFRPRLSVHIHHGPNRRMDASADVVLTTYALLRADKAELAQETWSVLVLDEAQAIKNPESLTARAAFQVPAELRIALSGTPVENRLDELWSQMHFANPGLLGGRSDFEDRLAKPIETGDSSARDRLRTRIRPFVLRRLKREVAKELPPRTDMVLTVDLDERERGAYDGIRAATKKEVVERLGGGASPLVVLEALLRLRQAACHTGLLPGREAEGSTKVDLLVETLEEAVEEGHKALVFSQWTGLLDLTEPWLQRRKLDYVRLDGSTRDRGAVVDQFQAEDGPPVMLISLKAGGTGLNLTAADHVFLLDPWWNPAVEDQAADRAHRIGQERPVMVHRLVARDTVEERILDLQEKKRALADAALGGAGAAARLTQDDLLALLD